MAGRKVRSRLLHSSLIFKMEAAVLGVMMVLLWVDEFALPIKMSSWAPSEKDHAL